jgi:flavin-dependent dehydrogenase
MVEKKRRIGLPVQCAEYIPKLLLTKLDLEKSFICQSVNAMHTVLPDGGVHKIKMPGYLIDRALFDQRLAGAARAKGAILHTGERAVSHKNGKVLLHRGTTIKPGVIIGCDGPHSTVRAWMGQGPQAFLTGLQMRAALKTPMNHTEIYFHPKIKGGYGWLFPKGKTANVGIGMRAASGASARSAFQFFYKMLCGLGKVAGVVPGWMGGKIPAGGPGVTLKHNMILAGDAAGHTHPVTGAGIANSVVCGLMAGKWGARAALGGDLNTLHEYEKEWRLLLADELKRAAQKRVKLESQWKDLQTMVRQCWPAFKAYYHDPSGKI